MAKYKVNKEKCLGIKNCGICINSCPGATQEGKDGKSEVINQEKIEECGGESVCPMGAIERIDKENEKIGERQKFIPRGKRRRGRRMGRGRGRRRRRK